MKAQKPRLVRTLQELVRIPSHESCEAISRYIAGEIRKLGIKPEVDRDGNVMARIGSGQAMLLNAHVDTVGVSGYKDPYSGDVRGDRLYGRGSTDDKSGIAAMLEIMKILKQEPPRKQVIFAFTVWEEIGDSSRDGAYKAARKAKATHALILESSVKENGSMGVSIGCKGRFVYRIEVLGKSSHSGRPWMGRNAIYLATRLIERLRGFRPTSMKIPGYGNARSYLTLTQIGAMEGTNVVPGKCSLTVDYRALPGEREPAVRKRIERVCKSVLGNSYTISAASQPNYGYVEKDPGFLNLTKRAVREAGMLPSTEFTNGWIDGMVFHSEGIITFQIGPGTEGQAHKSPEYCWIPGLVKGTHAVLNAIRRWDAQ